MFIRSFTVATLLAAAGHTHAQSTSYYEISKDGHHHDPQGITGRALV